MFIDKAVAWIIRCMTAWINDRNYPSELLMMKPPSKKVHYRINDSRERREIFRTFIVYQPADTRFSCHWKRTRRIFKLNCGDSHSQNNHRRGYYQGRNILDWELRNSCFPNALNSVCVRNIPAPNNIIFGLKLIRVCHSYQLIARVISIVFLWQSHVHSRVECGWSSPEVNTKLKSFKTFYNSSTLCSFWNAVEERRRANISFYNSVDFWHSRRAKNSNTASRRRANCNRK